MSDPDQEEMRLSRVIDDLRVEIEHLQAELDKAHRLLSQSVGWQRDAEIAKAKLLAGIQRIDGINDNPAVYNPDIEAIVRRLLDGEKG